MCGIAGVINLNGAPVSPRLLKDMTDAIAHRGPDGEGQWVEGNVGIGHRRLAIIDLTPAGHQPMISGNNRYVLSYNGEIYNYQEIRVELESYGYCFHSTTDTEVVLHALSHWGTGALLRFNGMFGLALWDIKERTLLLARDRYGIKPVYYSIQRGIFAFGSEQKAIIARSDFRRSLNKRALIEYFTFQNIFTNQTLLDDIYLLPAGHYLHLSLIRNGEEPNLRVTSYWDYRFRSPGKPIDIQAYHEELDRLFQQAVKRQLQSDVELGSYLSGGTDSGSITSIASTNFSYLKTFTCGFDLSSASGIELAFDERQRAEAMSARFKTEHYEIVLKAGDMERCLPKLTWHLEEPRVGQSYPNFYAAKLASKFVKVVLSGTGGDELFGGYPWRYYRAVVNQDFEHYIDQYYGFWQRLVPNNLIHMMFSPIFKDVSDVWTRDIFRDVFLTHDNKIDRPEDYINHSLYFEAKTFLHGLFIVEDKLSMSHGLENRVPFMDNDLVDFAMQCPVGLKLNNLNQALRINENDPGDKQAAYFTKTNDGKQILRKVMEGHLPHDILTANKQGFSAPDASWFAGESIEFVRRHICQNDSRIFEYLNRDVVISLINDHLEGRENRRLLIWSLISFEYFLNTFMPI